MRCKREYQKYTHVFLFVCMNICIYTYNVQTRVPQVGLRAYML